MAAEGTAPAWELQARPLHPTQAVTECLWKTEKPGPSKICLNSQLLLCMKQLREEDSAFL